MKKIVNKIKETFLSKKFLFYFVIGLINSLSSQSLYILFVYLKSSAPIASILSDVLTIVISYFLNMRFTYRKSISLKSFIVFPISYLPGAIINLLMVIFCAEVLNVPDIYAKIASIPITVPLNFIFMSFVVKKTTDEN